MAVITIIKQVKRVHSEDLALVKIGEFYHAYGKDACILAYLFDYKLKFIDTNCYTCGFPASSLNKVESELERNKINYILLDRRNNYDVDSVCDNKNLNTYQEVAKKAYDYIRVRERIENIHGYLMMNINNSEITETLSKLEEILKNDRREI